MKLIIIIALSTAVVKVDSCSCLPLYTMKEKFCSEDFVFHLKVISKYDPNQEGRHRYLQVTYDVEHIHVYRNASYLKELPKKMVAYDHESMCGVSFTEGKEYLVDAGNSAKYGVIHASSCGLSRPWAYLSPQDKVALSNYNCSTV